MPLLQSDQLTVRQDYGQFELIYGPTDLSNLVDLIGAANSGEGVAQDDEMLVVLSPHQNNFEMALTVEQWSAEPPDDVAEWEEGFEAPLTVADYGLEYMSPDDTCVRLDVAQGTYRVRILGRGFVNHGWPGSTTPGDVWRIQFWPSADQTEEAKRILRWEAPAQS